MTRRWKISRGVAAGVILLAASGCATGEGKTSLLVGLPPIPISWKCLSVDVAKELNRVYREETPTVEAALDRVNTAARIIEVGDLILHTLPISGGSEWPQKVNGSVPFSEEAALQQELQRDPAYYAGAAGYASPLKIKALYLQQVLFKKYPDAQLIRKMGLKDPSEAEVKAQQERVLGPNASPAFSKVFYRFLQYHPAYEPRPELFAGRVNGVAAEVYPGLFEAIYSLAENKEDILKLQESVLQAEEKKAKERRDILELVERIRKSEAAEFGNPASAEDAVEASNRDTNAKEIEDLKAQLAVQEEEFKGTVKAYKEELEKLGIELAKIKEQMGAFSPEQRALAVNVQRAVDAVQGTICQAEVLLGIAGYHMKVAGPRWKQEVQTIARQSQQMGNERIKGIMLNLATLPTNLSTLMVELGVLDAEAKVYDELFANRVTVDTSNGSASLSDGSASEGGWLSWLSRLWK